MNRVDQERLVERYLGGMMNHAEEEDFFLNIAVDRELRQTLKAYRIVDSAIQKHRNAARPRHDITRSRVVALLGAQAVAQPGMARPLRADTAPVPTRRSSRAGRLAPLLMLAIAIPALALGAFVVAPLLRGDSLEPAAHGRSAGSIAAPVSALQSNREVAGGAAIQRPAAGSPADAVTGGAASSHAAPEAAAQQEQIAASTPVTHGRTTAAHTGRTVSTPQSPAGARRAVHPATLQHSRSGAIAAQSAGQPADRRDAAIAPNHHESVQDKSLQVRVRVQVTPQKPDQ